MEKQPELDLPHYLTPKNDNERLLNYQYAYCVNGDKKALDEMYRLGKLIAYKYINSYAAEFKSVRALPPDVRQEKAHNAITYIIARYYKVNGWAIKKSFTAYIYLRVKHELMYKRKVDDIVDFVDLEEIRR